MNVTTTTTTITATANGKRGNKRKSYEAMSPPPISATTASSRGASKRSRAAVNGRQKSRGISEDMDEDEDDLDGDDGSNGDDGDMEPTTTGRRTKKPETEEEKRKNFLERNRQGTICIIAIFFTC